MAAAALSGALARPFETRGLLSDHELLPSADYIMNQKDQRAVSTLYANLLDEVKVRIDCVDKAVHGRTSMPGPLVREFCYLQLRILCELIALSCLVAHGDIAAKYSKRLGKEWSADKIIGELTKLHPNFYPQAMRQTIRISGGGWEEEAIHPSPLPKTELLELYGKCHPYLHRGNVKKLLNSETPIEIHTNLPEIIKWAQKINDLLSHHFIVLNPENIMFGTLRNAENKNRVQVGFMKLKPR